MIARTVNNLVPSQQLKQGIFKKYVSEATVRVNPDGLSEATVSKATVRANPDGLSEATVSVNPDRCIDIDAFPNYC